MALPLPRYSGVSVNVGTGSYLLVAPGATVTVYNTGTLVRALLYSDSGGTSLLPNPFTSDGVTGAFSFCVANGLYDITVTGIGVPPYTLAAVQLVYQATPVGQFLLAKASFTHAQILALPTTALTVIAAPGAGLTIVPLLARVVVNTAAGAYTNIDAGASSGTGGFLNLGLTGGGPDSFSYLVNRFGGTTVDSTQSLVTQFFGVVGQQLWMPTLYGAPKDPTDGATGPFFFNGFGLLGDPTITPVTTPQNQPLILTMTNGVLGNLTGGGLGNSLTATVAYLVL